MVGRAAKLIAAPAALAALGMSATTFFTAEFTQSSVPTQSPGFSGFRVLTGDEPAPADEVLIAAPSAVSSLEFEADGNRVFNTGGKLTPTAGNDGETIPPQKKFRIASATSTGTGSDSHFNRPRTEKQETGPEPLPPLPDSYWQWLTSSSKILIDQESRLLYFKTRSGNVESAAIAVGRDGYFTPTGQFRVQELRKNPTWFPTPSMKQEAFMNGEYLPDAVAPGPHNPLGRYFIRFQPEYGIHGTNKPGSIGRAISRGCVRMLNDDVIRLAAEVSVGDGVTIVQGLPAGEVRPTTVYPDYVYEPYAGSSMTPARNLPLSPYYSPPYPYGG